MALIRPRRGRAAAAAGLALPLLLLAAAPPAAAPRRGGGPAAACPSAEPRVRLDVEDPEPVVGAADIDDLHASSGRPRSAVTHHLGLTSSRIEWRSELTARVAPGVPRGRGSAAACAVPEEVTLSLALAEHRVRIAREIPEGGCLWREVLAHERRHVAVNRRVLRDAAARLRAAVRAWAAGAEARAADPDETVAALQRGLRRAAEPVLARMRAEQRAGHRAIDTPAEYRRLSRVCEADQRRLQETLREATRRN